MSERAHMVSPATWKRTHMRVGIALWISVCDVGYLLGLVLGSVLLPELFRGVCCSLRHWTIFILWMYRLLSWSRYHDHLCPIILVILGHLNMHPFSRYRQLFYQLKLTSWQSAWRKRSWASLFEEELFRFLCLFRSEYISITHSMPLINRYHLISIFGGCSYFGVVSGGTLKNSQRLSYLTYFD